MEASAVSAAVAILHVRVVVVYPLFAAPAR